MAAGRASDAARWAIRPASWDGFAAVMGEKGGSGGCWCMLWRLRAKDFNAGKGAGNRDAMRTVFAAGEGPGLVAWVGDYAVGWIQIAPRTAFPRLAGSRVLAPVDDAPVWSVACFLVEKGWRRKGLSVALLEAACGFAALQGAEIVEGYPVAPADKTYAPVYAWTGLHAAFEKAGFEEVARRSPTRPIMRRWM
ncbi:MAG: GNAT family N-acetyltransferase [Pseudomonadota bacterium]